MCRAVPEVPCVCAQSNVEHAGAPNHGRSPTARWDDGLPFADGSHGTELSTAVARPAGRSGGAHVARVSNRCVRTPRSADPVKSVTTAYRPPCPDPTSFSRIGPLVKALMQIQVVDLSEYKARKAAEQREALLATKSLHRPYSCIMNRLVFDPQASDCGCINGQSRWFQS
jgi:hypothetical protein